MHLQLVRSKTSTFLLCRALAVKYPRQPVLVCASFEPPQQAARPK